MTSINNGIGGFFKLEAVDGATGKRRLLADWFPNLVTDAGLNRLGSGGMWGSALVGSGSTAPAVGDTQLAQHIASTTTVQSDVSNYSTTAGDIYASRTKRYRFSVGTATGNLTEVGMSWSGAASGTLFCRSLIKDGNGDPTSITVLASEALDVTYKLRVYPPQTDVAFNVTIAGVTHACTLRACELSSVDRWLGYVGESIQYSTPLNNLAADGALGSITSYPSGNTLSMGTASSMSYSNNSYSRAGRQTCGLNDGNLAGGIRSVVFSTRGGGTYQCQFDPPIMKTSTKVLTLDFAVTWARRP